MALWRWFFGAAVLWAALGAPVAASAAPSASDDEPSTCAVRLYDPYGHLTKDPDLPALRHDINAAANLGATIRVRVYDLLPHGGMTTQDMNAQEKTTERTCPSWLRDGRRIPSLLVVAVAAQARQTGIYYGAKYSNALDNAWRNIERRKMNPKFQAGKFAAGLDAGLQAIIRKIKADNTGHATDSGLLFWVVIGSAIAAFILCMIIMTPHGSSSSNGSGGGGSTGW